jgi:hypothetical protein
MMGEERDLNVLVCRGFGAGESMSWEDIFKGLDGSDVVGVLDQSGMYSTAI